MNFREIRIKTPPKGENSKTYCPTRSTYKKPYKSKKNNVIKIYNGHNTQIVEFIKTKTYDDYLKEYNRKLKLCQKKT